MARYLLQFNRLTGQVSLTTFTGTDAGRRAMHARFRADAARESADVEIVVLQARDEEELRKTHRRYFESLTALTDRTDLGFDAVAGAK